MRKVLADLHVHVGRAGGRPVKITASPRLTCAAALEEGWRRKGLSAIGLVDCMSQPLLDELRQLLAEGKLTVARGGGLLLATPGMPREGLLVVPGSEVELLVHGAPVHFLVYLPDLKACSALRGVLSPHIHNADLGSQRAHGLSPARLTELAHDLGGVCGLAHAFTPHRGYFGSTGRPLGALSPGGVCQGAVCAVDFVEMGLSADTALAGLLPELDSIPLLASSDAHGPAAIAREATELTIEHASFAEILKALTGKQGRTISAYYGLDPRLGKYHRTACDTCGFVAAAGDPPVLACPACGERGRLTCGVLDRILVLSGLSSPHAPAQAHTTAQADGDSQPPGRGRPERPPYHHHVPLTFVPSVGPATRERLLERFGSEIAVLHHLPEAELIPVAGPKAAAMILAARRMELSLTAGGGGTFGRAVASRPS